MVGAETGPRLAVECAQVNGPRDEAIVLLWPEYAEIHRSTSASDDVQRWVEAWIAVRPQWVITDVSIDPAGLVEILTLRPPA
jgi:hypothetical protein